LGTRHTLASYLSRHTVPANTASAAHLFTGLLGKTATAALGAPISPTARRTLTILRPIVWPRFIIVPSDRSSVSASGFDLVVAGVRSTHLQVSLRSASTSVEQGDRQREFLVIGQEETGLKRLIRASIT
jgi:hypothetical protein